MSTTSDFDRYGRGGNAGWAKDDLGAGRVEDLENVIIQPVRRGKGLAAGSSSPISRRADETPNAQIVPPGRHDSALELAGRLANDDDEIQRVGGRRRIRSEFIVVPIGALFLIGALIKPWAGPTVPSPSASDLAPAKIVEAPTAGLIAAGPTNQDLFTVAPWNYVGPLPVSSDNANPGTSVPPDLGQGWASVDWSALGAPDTHTDWGFSSVQMPDLLTAAQPEVTAPQVAWTGSPGLAFPVTVSVPGNSRVFALAITWPSQQRVKALKFQYLGGPENPPYLPPAGFPPFTQVSPLPAAPMATPPPLVPNPGPTASPSPRAFSSAKVPSSTAPLHSGEFWVPPAAASWLASTADSVPSAWRQLPWSWPMGAYRVTIVTSAGSTQVILRLEPA